MPRVDEVEGLQGVGEPEVSQGLQLSAQLQPRLSFGSAYQACSKGNKEDVLMLEKTQGWGESGGAQIIHGQLNFTNLLHPQNIHYLSIQLSAQPPSHQLTHPTIHLSIHPPAHHPSIQPPTHLPFHLSTHLTHPPICPPIHLTRPPTYPPCPSTFPPQSMRYFEIVFYVLGIVTSTECMELKAGTIKMDTKTEQKTLTTNSTGLLLCTEHGFLV